MSYVTDLLWFLTKSHIKEQQEHPHHSHRLAVLDDMGEFGFYSGSAQHTGHVATSIASSHNEENEESKEHHHSIDVNNDSAHIHSPMKRELKEEISVADPQVQSQLKIIAPLTESPQAPQAKTIYKHEASSSSPVMISSPIARSPLPLAPSSSSPSSSSPSSGLKSMTADNPQSDIGDSSSEGGGGWWDSVMQRRRQTPSSF